MIVSTKFFGNEMTSWRQAFLQQCIKESSFFNEIKCNKEELTITYKSRTRPEKMNTIDNL